LLESSVFSIAQATNCFLVRRVIRFPRRDFDVSGCKKIPHPVIAGLTIDVASIVMFNGKGFEMVAGAFCILLEEIVEHLLPGRGMNFRGAGHDPVHIEDDRVEKGKR
jgi:hypothetical protein